MADREFEGLDFERPEDAATPRVCFCMHVHDATLRRAIRAGVRDVESLRNATGAATGCGTCRFDLVAILREEGVADPDIVGERPR